MEVVQAIQAFWKTFLGEFFGDFSDLLTFPTAQLSKN